MYKYVNSDRDRTGKLTISKNGDVQYADKLDIASSAALQIEIKFAKLLYERGFVRR